jgi:hypothetical protein
MFDLLIVLTAAVSAATEMQLMLLLSEFKAFGFCLGGLGFYVAEVYDCVAGQLCVCKSRIRRVSKSSTA